MPIAKRGLTPRQAAFVREYLIDLNATQAAIRAGYSAKTANREGTRLLSKAVIADAVAELQRRRLDRTEITAERVLEEMARLAFYDPTAVLEVQAGNVVTVKDPTTLPEDLRRAIVEITQVKIGDEVRYRLKLADKARALEMLGRHLSLFKDVVRVENVFEIVKAMDDATLDRRLAELERAVAEAATVDPAPGARTASLH